MNDEISKSELEMGPQPVAAVMEQYSLKTHDVVAASTDQVTHKMVKKACSGRRLSVNVQIKIMNAVNKATGQEYKRGDLFNY